MPTDKEWAKMSKAERAAYADTSGGPGGSFSGRSYPEYGHMSSKTDNGKGYKSLSHKLAKAQAKLDKGWK